MKTNQQTKPILASKSLTEDVSLIAFDIAKAFKTLGYDKGDATVLTCSQLLRRGYSIKLAADLSRTVTLAAYPTMSISEMGWLLSKRIPAMMGYFESGRLSITDGLIPTSEVMRLAGELMREEANGDC